MDTNKSLQTTGGGKNGRDPAPEVYRVALMFGICLLHSITMCGHVTAWAANVLLSCVNGFVFITGWYGLRFKPSKLVRLYAVTLFTGSVVLATRLWLGDFALGWEKETLSRVKDCYLGYWFLNAYAMLMLLAPLVDAAIERVPRRLLGSVLAPLGVLVFVWAFGAGVPILGWFFPASSGIGSYTGLALLATYTVARLCRVFDVARFFTWRRAAVASAALWLCTGVGLGEYASPFAAALSATLFLVFARVPWPGWVGRAACLLGPSMFAVYLLHCNGVGFGLMRALEDRLVDGRGWPLGAAYLAVAALAFGACVAIDLPRRLVVWGTRGLWAPLLAWADGWWARCFPDR